MNLHATKIDLRDVERGLRALARATTPRGAAWALRSDALADQRDHAKEQEGPSGDWVQRAPSTILKAKYSKSRKRIRGSRQRLLGRLPRTYLKARMAGDALEIYSNVPWSAIHQEGGTAGHGAKIPARPFLWFSERFFDVATRTLHARLYKAWGH